MADSALAPPTVGDEALLLARLHAGDEAAFDRLVIENTPRMLAVARNILPDESDAMDAVQDAFLSAWKSLDKFDGRSKLSTWLHQITVNACLMKLRTRRRRPETSIDPLLPAFESDGHLKNPQRKWRETPGSGIELRETRDLVRAKIAELPETYRLVLVLRDIEGLDTEQAAAVLEITPEAVRTRLHRARLALKALLEPHFLEKR